MAVPAIERDIAAAKRIHGVGTPIVIINGLYVPMTPDSSQLDSLVRVDLYGTSKH